MMFEKFMVVGEDYSGWLEIWEGGLEFPFILIIHECGNCGATIRTFRTGQGVEQYLDMLDEKEE